MTETSKTSLLSSRALPALFDELEKISQEITPEERRKRLKNWLKSSALAAGGAGLGAALFTVGDKLIGDKVRPAWEQMKPETRRAIVGGALGILPVAGALAHKKFSDEKKKVEEGS